MAVGRSQAAPGGMGRGKWAPRRGNLAILAAGQTHASCAEECCSAALLEAASFRSRFAPWRC
jgi:hypothetical protein